MAEPTAGPVRRIGTVTDVDGTRIYVGVDHDRMTIWTSSQGVVLDAGQRAQLHGLWVAAVVAIDEYKAATGDG